MSVDVDALRGSIATVSVWARLSPAARLSWWGFAHLPYPARALKPWPELDPDEHIYLTQALWRVCEFAREYERPADA